MSSWQSFSGYMGHANDRLYRELRKGDKLMTDMQTTGDSDTGKISDGYHTFDELYAHRCHLFVALMRSNPSISWRANNHDDGTMYEDWFVCGMHLPTGDISYHLPVYMWQMLDGRGIPTTLRAPTWDGHTAADVVDRLAAWCRR